MNMITSNKFYKSSFSSEMKFYYRVLYNQDFTIFSGRLCYQNEYYYLLLALKFIWV